MKMHHKAESVIELETEAIIEHFAYFINSRKMGSGFLRVSC